MVTELNEKDQKLVDLVKKAERSKRDNISRLVVRVVANAHKKEPENLKEYFTHDNEILRTVSTAAYGLLTGNTTHFYDALGSETEEKDVISPLNRAIHNYFNE